MKLTFSKPVFFISNGHLFTLNRGFGVWGWGFWGWGLRFRETKIERLLPSGATKTQKDKKKLVNARELKREKERLSG